MRRGTFRFTNIYTTATQVARLNVINTSPSLVLVSLIETLIYLTLPSRQKRDKPRLFFKCYFQVQDQTV